MIDPRCGREVFELFANLLRYPYAGLAGDVRRLAPLAARYDVTAAELLGEFDRYVASVPVEQLEELYTGLFDLDATCYPYVGYHLFGESYKRSVFLLGLKERFRAHGFAVDRELADHLAVVLRFLAVCDDAELVEELVRDGVLPALERMLGAADEAAPPEAAPVPARRQGPMAYRQVLEALQRVLRTTDAGPRSLEAQILRPAGADHAPTGSSGQ